MSIPTRRIVRPSEPERQLSHIAQQHAESVALMEKSALCARLLRLCAHLEQGDTYTSHPWSRWRGCQYFIHSVPLQAGGHAAWLCVRPEGARVWERSLEFPIGISRDDVRGTANVPIDAELPDHERFLANFPTIARGLWGQRRKHLHLDGTTGAGDERLLAMITAIAQSPATTAIAVNSWAENGEQAVLDHIVASGRGDLTISDLRADGLRAAELKACHIIAGTLIPSGASNVDALACALACVEWLDSHVTNNTELIPRLSPDAELQLTGECVQFWDNRASETVIRLSSRTSEVVTSPLVSVFEYAERVPAEIALLLNVPVEYSTYSLALGHVRSSSSALIRLPDFGARRGIGRRWHIGVGQLVRFGALEISGATAGSAVYGPLGGVSSIRASWGSDWIASRSGRGGCSWSG